jgi:hypothetical protein
MFSAALSPVTFWPDRVRPVYANVVATAYSSTVTSIGTSLSIGPPAAPHSAFSIRHSAFGIRHSAFGIRHSAFGIQSFAF